MAFRYFKSQTVNLATLALLVVAPLVAIIVDLQSSQWATLKWAGVVVGLLAATFHYWRLLKMHEAPISSIASAAQGYVELYGDASTDKPLFTPYHGIRCVWYRAWVFVNDQHSRGIDLFSQSRLLEYAESQSSFVLEDESAKCLIDPKGAEVIYFQARTWRKNNHRYVEHYLPTHQHVYVIGLLDTRKDVLDAKQINQQVSEHLKDLKSRPRHLLNLYDHDLNGEIDMDEWEQARQDAIHQVKAQHAMRAHTGSFVLSKPTDGHMFLISAKSPEQLRARHKHWLAFFLSISIAFLALSFIHV